MLENAGVSENLAADILSHENRASPWFVQRSGLRWSRDAVEKVSYLDARIDGAANCRIGFSIEDW